MLHWVATIEAKGMIKYQKSLPKGLRQISLRVKNSSYIRLTDKVLDALEKRVVSHSDLAAIICSDNLQRECTSCKKDITIFLLPGS